MIYADNAATTRISDSALEKMLPFLQEQYGNASSQYSLGAKAKRAIDQARLQVGTAIGAEPSDITFTSSGSESNNWAIRGVAESFGKETIHIITSSIEHPSVLNACSMLELRGVEVSYLPVNNLGRVSAEDVKAAIKQNTKLVSIILANNEIGTIQPIAEIGRFLHELDILFHADAVQAVGHIPVNVEELHVDFLTASAHKFNGAKGTGMFYKRSGINLPQLIFGGEQERGSRAGTENVAGIVAAGHALEESVANMSENTKRLKILVDITVAGIKKKVPNVRVNGDTDNRLPGVVNLGFDGVAGESLLHMLDLKGICVSTSSACSSGKDEPSKVILALGLTEQQAKSAIRISYGMYNTIAEAEIIASAIRDSYGKIMAS